MVKCEKMYKISIILSVYNVADKVKNAFNSIFNQTFGFENLEVIFVDDCSTDDSAKIINEFVDLYDNVKYYCLEKNSGYAGKPRNVGIEHATADYLMFLDPDDVYLENACEVLYDNISSSNLDFVSANYVLCYNNKERRPNWNKWYGLNSDSGEIIVNSIFDEPNLFLCPPSVWTKIVKKQFILKYNIDFPIGIPAQDFVFVQHCLLKANGIKYIDIPIVKYIPGDNNKYQSITSNRDKKLLSGYIKAYYKSFDILKNYARLIEYSVVHLQHWTKQLCFSNLDDEEKFNLLNFAYPLFEVYKNYSTNRFHSEDIKLFFEYVYEKKFIDALNLCEKIAINYDEYENELINSIKNKYFLVICNLNDLNNNVFKLATFLNEKNFNIVLVNMDDFEVFSNISEFDSFEHKINIYDYYSPNTKIDSKLNKYFNYSGTYCLCKAQNGKLLLKDCLNEFEITFDDINEFKNYFITELCIKFSEKLFIIYENLERLDVHHSLAFQIDLSDEEYEFSFSNSLNGNELNNCEQIFKEVYLDSIKKKYNHQDLLNNIFNKNDELIKVNKQLNKELSAFKSRKIIKLVDKSRSLLKKFD